MLIRRALLVAFILVLSFAGPAAADHTYDHVLPTSAVPAAGGAVVEAAGEGQVGVFGEVEGDLARTGSDSIVPLVQAAIVLVGGGLLLVFVARRRRVARRTIA